MLNSQPGNPQSEVHVSIDDLERWDREIVWHGFTQMQDYTPLLVERAEGCTLVDVRGRRYLDGVSSLWCNVHGHRHPRLDAALRGQLDRVAHVTSLGVSNPTTVRLAKRLTELAPPGLAHVFFSSDGASSVEVALKLAFQYWRQCPQPEPDRTRFVAFTAAYHGDTLGGVSVGGVTQFHDLFAPLLFDVIRAPAPDSYRLPSGVNRASACGYFLDQLREVLERHQQETAAVVLEPLVQGAAGIVVQPEGFLRGVRELTRQYNVLLIADEVAVGFGRTGRMFACEHEQVAPDLLCLGKGLTGGYLPMAATLTSDKIWSAFLGDYAERRTFFHGHTYGGNPLAAAVALASLDVFEQERVLQSLPAKVAILQQGLERIASLPHVGDARQKGLIGAVEVVQDKALRRPFPWQERRGQAVCDQALKRGVWLRPLGDVVVIMPPLAISSAELEMLMDVLEQSVRAALAS